MLTFILNKKLYLFRCFCQESEYFNPLNQSYSSTYSNSAILTVIPVSTYPCPIEAQHQVIQDSIPLATDTLSVHRVL